MSEISIHPAAMLFPMMAESELSALADDIKANGLLEPVVLYHGEVLDGRNRLAACGMAGVEPHFAEVDGNVPSPTIYALSKNLHRRHLTTNQKAVIAADVVPLLQAEANVRQMAGLKQNQSLSPLSPVGVNGRSSSIAARELGVGKRTVERVLEVKKKSPELYEKIKREEITPAAAVKMLPRNFMPPTEIEAYEPKTDRQKQLAGKQKERMIRALSTITGICRGIEEIDVRKVISVCDGEERNVWIERAKELASQLRAFSARLQKGF